MLMILAMPQAKSGNYYLALYEHLLQRKWSNVKASILTYVGRHGHYCEHR